MGEDEDDDYGDNDHNYEDEEKDDDNDSVDEEEDDKYTRSKSSFCRRCTSAGVAGFALLAFLGPITDLIAAATCEASCVMSSPVWSWTPRRGIAIDLIGVEDFWFHDIAASNAVNSNVSKQTSEQIDRSDRESVRRALFTDQVKWLELVTHRRVWQHK